MGKRVNTAVWSDKQKRWKINVQKDGERRSFYSSKPGRVGQREANKKADDWLDDNINSTSTRISRLYEEYLEEKKITTSYANVVRIESIAKTHILPAIGKIKISLLTEQKLQNIINKAYKKGLSRKTLQGIKETILELVKFCRKCGATTLYPENLAIPKGARYKGKNILQPDDLKKLFRCDKTLIRGKKCFEECIYAFRFQVLTGLRPGELLGLKWQDINDNIVNIQRSRNCYNQITTGKNENAIRSFYLSERAKEVLAMQPHYSGCDYVFGDMNLSAYRYRWYKYCEYNNIAHISPYELRHTFVSIAKNLPQGDLKTIVGHSKSMDTLGVYGHEVNGELENIANNLNIIYDDLLK